MSLATLLFSCGSSETVSSPDGMVTAQIVQQNEQWFIKVSIRDVEVAQWQIGGFVFEKEAYDFTGNLKQKGVSSVIIDEEYSLPTGKVSVYQNKANEKTVNFTNVHGKTMQLVVRAYNEGIAFRYTFDNRDVMEVKEERTVFVIPEASNIWAMEFKDNSENYYCKRTPAEMVKPPYHLPALIETPAKQWLLIHEADVLGRSAAAALSAYQGDGKFAITTTYPIPQPDQWLRDNLWLQMMANNGNTVIASPYWMTPWRMMLAADNLATIVESTMTENLNLPSTLGDESWIKPGVAVFPWWGDRYGANNKIETLKKYVDMAKEMNWNILEFDIGLIRISDKTNKGWQPWPTISWIKEVIDYARERGIMVYGWDECRNMVTPEERSFIYQKYKEWGIEGFKIDHMNSNVQKANDFRKSCLVETSQYKLMASFHGEYTPRGERRSYPHLVAQEGVKGSEFYILGDPNIPDPQHNATIPFTRNVIGPMDYTPTAYSTPLRTSSYAHETALPFVYESGWVCMCDKPEFYLLSPARPVLQEIEATWDEIKYIDGYPGEYVVIARRKGQKWTVGALNGGAARKVTIPLDFLGGKYRSLLLCEDDKTDPHNQCIVRTVSIENQKTFSFEMAENGGFVAITK